MSPCERLSDRIPDVAGGRSRWSPEEVTHLAGCPDCRAEWDLVVAVNEIGARAPKPADPATLADAILRRLADARRARLRSRRGWVAALAVAAAIALVVWGGVQRLGPGQPGQTPVAAADIALPELEPLETAELDSLLEALDDGPGGWSALVEPSLGDLDADELERVLRTWEG